MSPNGSLLKYRSIISIGCSLFVFLALLKTQVVHASDALSAYEEQSRIEAEIERKKISKKISEPNPEIRKMVQEKLIPAQQKTQTTINENSTKILNPKTHGLLQSKPTQRKIGSESKNEPIQVDPKSVPKIYRFGQKK